MDKIVILNQECKGQTYYDFLDYAFSQADYFMLVYVNYYRKGYTKSQKHFKTALNPYKVKSRSNPSWPGTLRTVCPNTTYKIVFYRTDDGAKKILKEVESLYEWSRPNCAEDLAFFKGNHCWFYSVGHEKMAAIIHANGSDLAFVESKGLASYGSIYDILDNYYDAFDEDLDG